MKRVVAITVIMVVVTTLFAFPAFGVTNGYHFPVLVSNTSISGSVTATLNVSKFIVNADSVITGGGQIPFLITVELRNDSTQDALVNLQDIYVSFDTTAQVSNYELFSTDLHILPLTSQNPNTDPPLYVLPSNDFSYQGGIVVPAKSRLYAASKFYIYSPFDSQTQTWGSPTLLSCMINITNVQYGNYAHGDAIDFSPLIDALTGDDDISMTEIADLLTEIKSINNTSYTNIINALSYTGVVNLNIPYLYLRTDTFYLDNIAGASNNTLRWSLDSPCIDSIDFELNTANDTLVLHYSYHRHVTVCLTINATDNISIDPDMRFMLYKFGLVTRGIDNVKLTSNNIATYLRTGNAIYPMTIYKDGLYRPVFIKGQNMFLLEYDLYFTDANNDVTLPVLSDMFYWSHNTVNYITGDYKLNDIALYNDISGKLSDIYNSLTKDEDDDNTEEAQDMNDEIHQKEQVWYDNNSDALEAVGLSNYRFSQSQSSGITQAVTQFQAVWNALGQWTNVYIFILILSISTYIIRHEPTTRVKQYRSSVQAERAERISYYGRKNAESRASSSGSTLKNAIRRRK